MNATQRTLDYYLDTEEVEEGVGEAESASETTVVGSNREVAEISSELPKLNRRESLIWMAAFLDSEGCLYITKRRAKSARRGYAWMVRVTFTNCDVGMILHLEDCLRKAGVSQFSTRRRKLPSGRDAFQVMLCHNACRQLLPQVLPFLIAKRKQAILCLKALSLLPSDQRAAQREGRRRLKLGIIKADYDYIIEDLKKEVMKLHLRPGRPGVKHYVLTN